MDIILNQIAIWKPCLAKELSIRKSPKGERYREPGGMIYKQAAEPLVRYSKCYAVDGVEFSLFVRTFCEDKGKVEAALDYYAAKITKEYCLNAVAKADMQNFEYTPFVLEDKQTIAQEK